MINRKDYYQVLAGIRSRTDYSFRLLMDSLEYDPVNQHLSRLILLEDILSENEAEISRVFDEVRGVDISEVAFNTLIKLPPQLIRDNAPVFDRIFLNAVNKKYGAKGPVVINNIRSIIARTKAGISLELLIKSMMDERIDLLNRTRLAISLTEIDEYGDFFEWGKSDVVAHPWLLPAFLFYYSRKKAKFSFTRLFEVRKKPAEEVINHLYRPLTLTIKQLLLADLAFSDYRRVTDQFVNSWQNKLILEILKTETQLDQFIKEHTPETPPIENTATPHHQQKLTKGEIEAKKEVLDSIRHPFSIRRKLSKKVDDLCGQVSKN